MTLRDRVLAYLEEQPGRFSTLSRMASELGFSGRKRFALLGVLRSLASQGFVEMNRKGVRLSAGGGAVAGTFHAARGGFGFLTPEEGGEDLFVPPGKTGGALEGDRVTAFRVPSRGGSRMEAHVHRVLARSRRPVLGIVQGGVLLPLGGSLPPLALARSRALEGRVVSVIPGLDAEIPTAEGAVLVGDPDDPETPVRAAVLRYGLERTFPEEAEREAEEAARLAPRGLTGRRDLRDLPAVTIDPEDARDHDDAVSVLREGEGFRLFVHIADVAFFVRPGTALDAEARRRGNSVYLPRTVFPMLPHALSSGACSLREGEDRLAVTVEMDVAPGGRIRSSRFYRSLIRSRRRLTYEEAQGCLEGSGSLGEEVDRLLGDALACSRALFERRLTLGTLDLDLPEALVRFGLSGRVEEVLPSVRLQSHRIVEEAMLAANVAVAREVARRKAPALFRVHDPPDPEKLEALRPLLNALGLGSAARGDLSDPFVLQELLRRCEGHRAAKLVSYLLLRAMAQARYAAAPRLHYGLGFPCYAHFTSPIRRYPDLTVHRALLEGGAGGGEGLDALADHCSQTERTADQAEREVVAWYQVSFLAQRLGETFEAVILGFNRGGVRVELTDHLIEGYCPFALLEGEGFTVDRDRLSARSRGGFTLKVGDAVSARLVRVDRLLGEAHFTLENLPRPRSGKGRRRGVH